MCMCVEGRVCVVIGDVHVCAGCVHACVYVCVCWRVYVGCVCV